VFGLISKMTAVRGERERLASILTDATQDMPGCLSYVIALDTTDADSLWITEVWDDRASHAASLTLPPVQAAIVKAKPLIASFSNRVETTPITGHGLQWNRK
jgi:quinol monooxygenase YgiN